MKARSSNSEMSANAGDSITSLSFVVKSGRNETFDFFSKKSLAPRTTTDLDTNPVLSNISLPTTVPLEAPKVGGQERLGFKGAGGETSAGTSSKRSSLQLPPHSIQTDVEVDRDDEIVKDPEINRKSDCYSPDGSITDFEQSSLIQRPYPMPLESSARNKRASIYQAKYNGAIPIRGFSHASHTQHIENDDKVSVKSFSSTLTASFSKSFLFGFYNNYKNAGKIPKSVLSKEYWMKDESAKDCFACTKPFTTFRRKHHCRICGQIFCSSCSFLIDGRKYQHAGRMRVCRNCHAHFDSLEDSSDESSIEELESAQQSVGYSPEKGFRNPDVLLLKDDEVQSILTTGEGANLFRSTPPPPPKMAIPATRKGGSLEITVPSMSSLNASEGSLRQRSSLRDRYTIRDVDILQPFSKEENGKPPSSTRSHHGGHPTFPQISNLKHSISSYISNASTEANHSKSQHSSNSVIANLSNNDFKFEFNYGVKNFQDFLNTTNADQSHHERGQAKRIESSPVLASYQNPLYIDSHTGYSDEESEDERSMSLYAALNESHQDSHYARPTRNGTKSLQRAQASLQRMRSRRKSKSRAHLGQNVSRKQFEFLNHSSPNLNSTGSQEDYFSGSHDSNSNSARTKPRNDLTSSRDMRRIISTASVLRMKSQGSKTELSEVSQLHMNALLRQVLNDQNVDNVVGWIKAFGPILEALQGIRLDARNQNGLDFKQHHIKIKRIDGATIDESKFINGLIYSKNLPLKTMPRLVKSPRILLIMFPLEYQKNENHFLSIDSVLAQEREYLKKLVLRLTSLNPDLILIGANVSGYALELLNEAKIVVQFNMKPQVIERVAKLTDATIAITVDKLATNMKLGTCASFEVKAFRYSNLVKSYTFLEGCKPSMGGTILLRGSSSDVLRKIKDITEFMVYSVFSLKLESSFFSDNFLQLSVGDYERFSNERMEPSLPGYFSDFVDKFHQRILSISPTVEFHIPFLLEKARTLEQELLKKENQGEFLLTNYAENSSSVNRTIQGLGIEPALTNNDIKNLVKFVHDKEVEDLKGLLKWRSRQWELSYALSKNMLGTGTHQSINVLYSMISKKTATPCVGPQLVTIDYFWDTDISIGQFIENIVATADYPCAHGCDALLIDHFRSYVHGTGKVDVLIEQFQSRLPSLKNILLTWSYCKNCNSSSPILQMSEKTWNYSFGKYLELMFWSKSEGIKTVGNCRHDFAKDHVKYFGFNDLMVRMEYSDVEVHELITPRSKITWKPNIDIKLKVELYYQILERINNFYGSVSDRLVRVKLDGIPSERVTDGEGKIKELKDRASEEKLELTDQTDSIYRNTPGDQHLVLNEIIRSLHNNAAGWDLEFIEFEKTFLPSERDVARITAVQLKKLFSDAVKDEQEQRVLARNSVSEDFDQRTIRGHLDSTLSDDLVTCPDLKIDLTEQTHEQLPRMPRPPMVHHRTAPALEKFPKTNLLHLPKDDIFVGDNCSTERISWASQQKTSRTSSVLSDGAPKVSQCMRSYSTGSEKSNNTLNTKEHSSGGKVGQLASFFDQIHFDALSREFELQREFERLQLNKNKYKALRVEPSKPIVEIYKNVKDAVDRPLHTENQKKKLPFTNLRHEWNANEQDAPSTSNELGNKLKHSIHQWGEQILRSDGGDNSGKVKSSADDKEQRDADSEVESIATTPHVKIEESHTASQPERSSLMKTLANFWADRSATLWKSLDYPTLSTEHIFVDSPVIIREDEPCSLIAFCLSSSDYLNKMKPQAAVRRKSTSEPKYSTSRNDPHDSTNSTCLDSGVSDDEEYPHGETSAGKPILEKNDANVETNIAAENGNVRGLHCNNDVGHDESVGEISLESIMTKKTAMHLRYQFQDGTSIMSCKIFFAEQFDAFRKTCGCEDNFIQSLSRCVKWDSSGGKSGSAFLKTLDNRFVIKELSHTELDSFIKFAPSYFEYMAQAMFHDLPTALAKVFGFYQIQTKNSESGRSFKMDVLIMENLFYNKKTSRIFDLKGSMRNRHVKQTGKENEVLLDENMVEYIYESPIFVREYDKKLLRASLWNDTLFLAKMNVMDYSLVVGVDSNDHTLTVGIIDFIRTFTWDKKLESWVKERGFVGGSTKEPTVVTPRQYKNRFRVAMERYILMVPDPWFQESHN
ncbi:LADA_0H16490g1_1 [Lachancea dasiensis]|uniref:1-phosphatidylinositol-3-phosphate 5-kinase n=1 Tax=Lachancea dasiensis TaxID=1072105 RepID=A0A1G4K576_9SACH|nr:LADA_0H16490g1_1 [Lachancea dasiensis]